MQKSALYRFRGKTFIIRLYEDLGLLNLEGEFILLLLIMSWEHTRSAGSLARVVRRAHAVLQTDHTSLLAQSVRVECDKLKKCLLTYQQNHVKYHNGIYTCASVERVTS